MLAYAAHRPVAAQRRSSPNAMLIVGVHVAAIAAVMSAKMDCRSAIIDPPIDIDLDPADRAAAAGPASRQSESSPRA